MQVRRLGSFVRQASAVAVAFAVMSGPASIAAAAGGPCGSSGSYTTVLWENQNVPRLGNTYRTPGYRVVYQSQALAGNHNYGCANIYLSGGQGLAGSFACTGPGQIATFTDLNYPSAEAMTWNDSQRAQNMTGWEVDYSCNV